MHIRGDISGDRRNVGRIATSPHESPQGYGFKLISALLFAGMSALVRQLGDVAPVGQVIVMLIPHFDLSHYAGLALHQSLPSDLRSRSLPRFAMPERSSKLGDLRKMKPRHR
ncbi:MAG: hypothetical protein WA725_10565, partial [Pseudolabrys sp.]